MQRTSNKEQGEHERPDHPDRARGRRVGDLLDHLGEELRGEDAGEVLHACAVALREYMEPTRRPRRRADEATDLDVARARRLANEHGIRWTRPRGGRGHDAR
ncbi:hypothetical protein [Polyangium sp. 6x1]|uniref:hypothetical protein n=1 Tax=Polyangium sp. 6x1 TaxID=3042689 RepID=UPI0024821692|nr:hypothetical protein [Polyangium sp. 6x1]MDI1444618.1 hypothetical protein [Polyangium sp. 6x1]